MLNIPQKLSFKEFALKGDLSSIKLGQKKSWIAENFIPAESDYNAGYDMSILSYGALEFHFMNDILNLIWCDNIEYLNSYNLLEFDLWFLADLEILTLKYVSEFLISQKVDYAIQHNKKPNNTILTIKNSGVALWFEIKDNDDYPDLNPNEYAMIAFGLSAFSTYNAYHMNELHSYDHN